MSKRALDKNLHQHWVHSHEEDTDAEMVFRPADHPFPPSRGRMSFELKPGGRLVDHPLGPDDRAQSTTGTWEKEGYLLTLQSSKQKRRVLHIVAVDHEKLVIEK